jgi:GR25 family glycosyltransferase involved in LPS biosynthesis
MKISKLLKMHLIKKIILIILILIICYILFKFTMKEGLENTNKKHLDGVDIIYWINLERSKDRKNDMEKMLKDEAFNGIPNQRIEAYDGKMNPKSVFDKLEIPSKYQTNTEYACLLSHLESIRTFNESKYNVALIFEDDVTLEFKKYWKKSVREIINNAPPDWDIILLTYIYDEKNDKTSWDNQPMYDKVFYNKNNKNNKNNNNKYWSTLSYIINKNGSKKILTNYKNDKYYLPVKPANVADVYLYNLTNSYVYKYPYFIYKTDNNSTIHPEHILIHNESKKKIENNYQNMIKNDDK